MSKNNIDTLRDHLFDTLTALKDRDNPMDIERAKAVTEVAQVIINSAKVEVDMMKVTGSDDRSQFLEHTPELPEGITGSTVHRLKG